MLSFHCKVFGYVIISRIKVIFESYLLRLMLSITFKEIVHIYVFKLSIIDMVFG